MGRLGSEVKFTLAYKWQICLNIQISSAYKVKGRIATFEIAQYLWNTVHLQIGAGAKMLRPFYCTGTDDQNILWYWHGTPKQISVAELKAANVDDMQS